MTKKQHGSVTGDYSYRSTWDHKFRRAKNKAKRGGLTKKQMFEKYGRFPRKHEWWGEEENEKEWREKWIRDNPRPIPNIYPIHEITITNSSLDKVSAYG